MFTNLSLLFVEKDFIHENVIVSKINSNKIFIFQSQKAKQKNNLSQAKPHQEISFSHLNIIESKDLTVRFFFNRKALKVKKLKLQRHSLFVYSRLQFWSSTKV